MAGDFDQSDKDHAADSIVSGRVLLIDADILIFQAASAAEVPIQWDEDLWTLHSSVSDAALHLENAISGLREMLRPERLIFAISSPKNWRKEVLPTYKSNRKAVRKPLCLRPLRNYLADLYDVREFENLEGDDTLGILATAPNPDGEERIVVSIDKDFRGVPGRYFNWRHAREAAEAIDSHDEAIMPVSVEEADRFHLVQAIAGDQTDGYGGVPGFGMTTAARLLEGGHALEKVTKVLKSGPRKGLEVEDWVETAEPSTPWEIVVSAYASKGLSEEVALQTARVARILRYDEFNQDTGEVKLWSP